MDYDPSQVERKWRERWAEEGTFEADPAEWDDDPTFVTVPYPYPSGGMHIGHARTYTVPDVYARYRRLQGDNVLFPIAWHVTGTPIVGAVERLKGGDDQQVRTLRDTFGVPEDVLADLETPMGYARHFIEEADCSYKTGMKQLGLSIDWRREFTTNDERYSKFITWQYETLRDRGLLERGLHPVKYCTNEHNPVTTHDLLEGEEAEFQEYTLVRFRLEGEGSELGPAVAPMATLRPETVRGVTNAYVNPDATYVRATVGGGEASNGDPEEWIVSEAAVEKLRLQERDIEITERFDGETLVGERVTNPVTGDRVLVLPAAFVDPDNATGVVMSVPAHSPDDYVALEEMQADADRLREYGVDPDEVRAIEPVPILTIEGYGEIPARDAVREAGIERQDDPALEEVTQELYNHEFHRGELIDAYGEFAGAVVEDVREAFREHHREAGAFDAMYEFTENVVCRCGGDVEVARQETWFLRYNDAEWKAKAHRAVEDLTCLPENTRDQYDHTIDWLNEWPCIRNYGLGTRLPWDTDFVIEPLSDSTIYMAYYTVAPGLREVPVEDLDRDFFDVLFYGPDGETAPAGVDVDVADPDERALSLREEWSYWYPVDFRCSGNDLIQNHLTFFLFHHAELFDESRWPGGITIMGMGLLQGEKMSSSKGHVVLPGEAIDAYGADTVRFFLVNSAEPWQDYDWRADQVETTRDQLTRFWNRAREVIDLDGGEGDSFQAGDRDLRHIDRWLLSKLQGTIRETTEALEVFQTRTASQTTFYGFEEHLRWYRRRADLSRPGARWTLRTVLRTRLCLLAPMVPFLANELHEQLTGVPPGDWPEPEPALESERTEVEEQLIERLTDDVAEVIDVTGADPDVIRVYVAADWKGDVFDAAVEHGPDVGDVMEAVMAREEMRQRGQAVNDVAGDLAEFVRGRPDETLTALQSIEERSVYEHAADFLSREFDADVAVYGETDEDLEDPGNKAGSAVPFRPAIHIA